MLETMKTTHCATRLRLAALVGVILTGCDLDPDPVDPDPVDSDPPGVPVVKSRSRESTQLSLQGGAEALPKGTRTVDTHELKMDRLGVTIESEGDVQTGSASIEYRVERDVTVMFPSIWKLSFGEVSRTIRLKPRGADSEEVMEYTDPLSQEVVIRDGSRFSLERAGASDAQKEALKSLRFEWLGGDELFTDGDVRRRDSWAIKPEVMLQALLGATFTESAGSAHLFVQRTLDFDGEKVAEVSVSVERCRGTMLDSVGDPVEVELHGHGKLHRRLDPLHTTQVDLEGTAQMTVSKPERTLKFSGPFHCRSRSRLELP